MAGNYLWHAFSLVVQYAPGLIDLLTLVVTLVILLAAFMRSRR